MYSYTVNISANTPELQEKEYTINCNKAWAALYKTLKTFRFEFDIPHKELSTINISVVKGKAVKEVKVAKKAEVKKEAPIVAEEQTSEPVEQPVVA